MTATVIIGIGTGAERVLDRLARKLPPSLKARVFLHRLPTMLRTPLASGLGGRIRPPPTLFFDPPAVAADFARVVELASRASMGTVVTYVVLDASDALATAGLTDMLAGYHALYPGTGAATATDIVAIVPTGNWPGVAGRRRRAVTYITLAELRAQRDAAPSLPPSALTVDAVGAGASRPPRPLYRQLWLLGAHEDTPTETVSEPPSVGIPSVRRAERQAAQWLLTRIVRDAVPVAETPEDLGFAAFGVAVAGGTPWRAERLRNAAKDAAANALAPIQTRYKSLDLGATPSRLRSAALLPIFALVSGGDGDDALATKRRAKALELALKGLTADPEFWPKAEALEAASGGGAAGVNVSAPVIPDPPMAGAPLAIANAVAVVKTFRDKIDRQRSKVTKRIGVIDEKLARLKGMHESFAYGDSTILRGEGARAAASLIVERVFERFDRRMIERMDLYLVRIQEELLEAARFGAALEGIRAECAELLTYIWAHDAGAPGLTPVAPSDPAPPWDTAGALLTAIETVRAASASPGELTGKLLDMLESPTPPTAAFPPANLTLGEAAWPAAILGPEPLGSGASVRRTALVPGEAAVSARNAPADWAVAHIPFGDDISYVIEAVGLPADALSVFKAYRTAFLEEAPGVDDPSVFERNDIDLMAPDVLIPLSSTERAWQMTALFVFAQALTLELVRVGDTGSIVIDKGMPGDPQPLPSTSLRAAFRAICADPALVDRLRDQVQRRRTMLAGVAFVELKLDLLLQPLAPIIAAEISRALGVRFSEDANLRLRNADPEQVATLRETAHEWAVRAPYGLRFLILAES